MRKLYFSLFFAFFSIISLFAQGLQGDGFYHVQNYGSSRYVYVNDNTGSIMYNAGTADMGAIWTWKGLEKTISDPSAVIYISKKSDGIYDLESQGTGVHDMIGYYVNVSQDGSHYQVYAKNGGVTLYLDDELPKSYDYGYLGTSKKGNFRLWDVYKLDNNSEHFFGLNPTVHVGGKHYAPFYASFAFSFASSGMKAYYISKIDLGHAILAEWNQDVIPANMPVIVECSSTEASSNKLNVLHDGGTRPGDNKLQGVYFANVYRPASNDAKTVFNPSVHRVLGVTLDGKLGYINRQEPNGSNPVLLKNEDEGFEWEGYCLAANQSYLTVDASLPTELPVWTAEEYAAALEEMNKEYTLSYMVDGVLYHSETHHSGDAISLITAPTKEGYTFSGWSGYPADLIMPAHDVTVSGSFSVNSYQVIYTVDGNEYDRQTVAYGAQISLIAAPTKEGYTFSGWSGYPANLIMPAHDVTVSGSFSVNSYQVIYTVDGNEYDRQTVAFGAQISLIAAPTKEGHTFSGWSGYPADLVMPAHDVNVNGSFAINVYSVSETHNEGGTVELSATQVEYGGSLTFTVVASENYEIGSVTVNDTDVTASLENGVGVIENIRENVTIVVVFNESTGIGSVSADKSFAADAPVYNLVGKQLCTASDFSSLPSGVYIVGGKKIVKF